MIQYKYTFPRYETGDTLYTYDRMGRLTCTDDSEGNTVSYTYDEAGNVSGITYPDGGVISYKYDKNNNLISVKDATGKETRYSYDVNREYTQVLMERDGSGALSTAYVYGNERLSIRSTKKESGYYLYDGRGSVTGIVSILGERFEIYSYDSSGQAMRTTSTNRYQKTFYGYNAESYDPKTGSVYLRARYYNTRTGSFSTKDTYLGDLMEPLGLNRYSYTWGNPVNYQDPSGHAVKDGMVVENRKCVFYENGKVVEKPLSGMPAADSANIQTTISAIPDDYTGRGLCGFDVNGLKHYYYVAEAYIKGVSAFMTSAPEWIRKALIYNSLLKMGIPESVINGMGYSRSDQLEYETMIARGESGAYYEYFDDGYKDGYAFYILQQFYTALAAIAAVYGGLSYNSYGKETSVDDLVEGLGSDTTQCS